MNDEKFEKRVKHSELTLYARLVVLKRLMGISVARFEVVVDENNDLRIHHAGQFLGDEAAHPRNSEESVDESVVPQLRVGDRTYVIPELLDEAIEEPGYFG